MVFFYEYTPPRTNSINETLALIVGIIRMRLYSTKGLFQENTVENVTNSSPPIPLDSQFEDFKSL